MNILYYDPFIPDPHTGGVQRITYVMSHTLSEFGHNCYVLYTNRKGNEILDLSKDKVEIAQVPLSTDPSLVVHYLRKWSINIVILQGYYPALYQIKKAVSLCGFPVKLIYVYHARPGWSLECYNLNWLITKRRFHHISIMKTLLQLLSWPLFKYHQRSIEGKRFREIESLCDVTVLLSRNYEQNFLSVTTLKEGEKLRFIPNALSFRESIDKAVPMKKKKVLIVSRMEEYPKNILEALEIWREIEHESQLDEWELNIVGDGPHIDIYKNYALQYLKRVRFWGHSSPESFYQESSIFMMTSRSEGWPLTLLESQQTGCVPIVYNSFESLSDIITNGINGIIVSYHNKDNYVQALKRLMLVKEERETMAYNAMKDCQRYSPFKVAILWDNLFNELTFES